MAFRAGNSDLNLVLFYSCTPMVSFVTMEQIRFVIRYCIANYIRATKSLCGRYLV